MGEVDQQSAHLSDAQIGQYGSTASAAGPEAGGRPDQMEMHLADCPACRNRVLASQRARLALLTNSPVKTSLRTDGPGPKSPGQDCPSESDLRDLAAGLCPYDQAAQLTEHAAQCDHCGPSLRMYTEDFSDELSKEDEAVLGKLKSASAGWRTRLGERMLAGAGRAAAESAKKPFPWKWVLAPAAVAACAALAIGLYPRWEASHARELVAAEYRKGRPMSYRASGVPHGPVRTERGQSVVLGAVEIPDGKKLPWLAADAAFLARNSSLAKSILEDAYHRGDDSLFVLDDLVVAYAMEAERTGNNEEYLRALEISKLILSKDSSDATTYFNQALILERLGRRNEAIAVLQKFLLLEKDPGWISEATEILHSLS